jgi:tetratricopeptide (TPR) repeat protein
MKKLLFLPAVFLLTILAVSSLNAQCENWNDSARKGEAEDAHVVYRSLIKGKQVDDLVNMGAEEFKTTFDNWKVAYTLAPAADGKRASHYSDGRKLYLAKFKKETDEAKKKEYADVIRRLYDEQMVCYSNEGFLLGRKGFDMFYVLGDGYSMDTYETLKSSVEKGGNATEYIVFDPLTKIMVYQYQAKQLTREQVIEVYDKVEGVIKYNIENNKNYSEYFEDVDAIVAANFKDVAGEIFDCNYFKKRLLPKYKENPENIDVIRYVYGILSDQDCDEGDAEMLELKNKYEVIAKAINDSLELVRRQENPLYDAAQLQKEGKYNEAIDRYNEGIESSEDNDAIAQAYYSIAFIQTWQKGQYQTARSNARKAADLKPGWGKPYILIGDMYAKSSRSCGDDWGSRLAILAAISKYRYAKSIDSEVAEEANKRIGSYAGARPEKQEGFMRGVSAGQKAKVPCWIGETVTVEFRD